MADAFLDRVRAQREQEMRERDRIREEEEAASRVSKRKARLALIREAGDRNNELIRERRANGIAPPARRRGKGGAAKSSAMGAGAPEMHDVNVGDLPHFRLGADE